MTGSTPRPAEAIHTTSQFEISRDAYERLKAARDARGRQLEVHKLAQPGPLRMTRAEAEGVDAAESAQPRQAGARLAGSYVNFYIGSRRVVVPLLDAKRDGAALGKLRRLFPGREIVGVPGRGERVQRTRRRNGSAAKTAAPNQLLCKKALKQS